MSIALNVFKDYTYDAEKDKIVYIDNESIDLCASTWKYKVYPILKKASELTGVDVHIPCYDVYDDAELAKTKSLELVAPEVMVIALEAAREYYKEVFDEAARRDMVSFIDNMLLHRAKKGMYFVEARE